MPDMSLNAAVAELQPQTPGQERPTRANPPVSCLPSSFPACPSFNPPR
jgi:hypothetical protein